jgi:DNA-binding MarR family transcriptional regulator
MDTVDRRRVTLVLSSKGRAALEKLAPAQCRVNDVEFGSLSREEFRQFNNFIRRMIEDGERAVALQKYLLAGGRVSEAQ